MLPLAILAGGYGTRLGSITKNLPKCLVEVNGKPFVDWQLTLLSKEGFSEIVFCVSYKSKEIQDYIGDGSRWGLNIKYSLDGDTQLGTGGAIRAALPLLGSSFGVIYGDSYLAVDYSSIDRKFQESNDLALMSVYKNENNFDSSNVEFKDGILINYKKGSNSPEMHYIDYGLTYFREEAFTSLDLPKVFDLSELCHKLSKARQIKGYEVFIRFYEIGSPEGLDQFSKYIRKATDEL